MNAPITEITDISVFSRTRPIRWIKLCHETPNKSRILARHLRRIPVEERLIMSRASSTQSSEGPRAGTRFSRFQEDYLRDASQDLWILSEEVTYPLQSSNHGVFLLYQRARVQDEMFASQQEVHNLDIVISKKMYKGFFG